MDQPNQLKENITDRLNEMIESRFELIKNAQFLSILGIENKTSSYYYIHNCIEAVAEGVITQLCEKLTRQWANGTPARITVDNSLYKLASDRYRDNPIRDYFIRHQDGELERDKQLVDVYLSHVDFERIAQSIQEQINHLEGEGLAMLAASLADEFGLRYLDRRNPFSVKNGWIICESYAPNWNHSFDSHRQTRYAHILSSFRFIREDAGVDLEPSFEAYVGAVRQLSYDRPKIESRTVFGKGSSLQIACFKDKIEYRFTRSAFEAIAAFLMLNGFESQAGDVLARLNTLQAA